MTMLEESKLDPPDLEHKVSQTHRESLPRMLCEEEALALARSRPDEAIPMQITFGPSDKDNPRNWGKARRWYITLFVCWLNVATCLCAGSISSGAEQIQSEFGVVQEVTTLALSLYVLGYAIGPVLLAPLSEYYGRQPIYIVSWFLLMLFQMPLALAPNIGTILVCRLIAGLAGGAPLTNTGGTVSDLWERNESGSPMSVYGLSSTFGPPMALVISGYISLNLGWRWIFWVLMIITGAFWIGLVTTIPETRHTIRLQRKTQKLARLMRKEGLKSADAITDAVSGQGHAKSMHELFSVSLTRPFRFLFTEPITAFSAIYNGFLYGLVYLFNEAFPLVFGEPNGHGFNVGQQGLTFLGMAIGPLVAFAFHPLQERVYLRRVAANNGRGVPEARMWMARLGAIFIPVSLFWYGWTSYQFVHWVVPIVGSAFFGAGIYIVILAILSYVVDSYQTYSASALAGVILVRNLVGAGFPLFATQMYERLGYEWASSLLGFLGILLVPIPFILYYKGETIRLRSPFAREHFDQTDDVPH